LRALLQGVKALEPRVVPVEAAKISAQDRAAIAAVEAARRQQKKSLWLTVGSMVATVLLVAFVVYTYIFKSNERFLEAQVAILPPVHRRERREGDARCLLDR
jgi:hypothetical protein